MQFKLCTDDTQFCNAITTQQDNIEKIKEITTDFRNRMIKKILKLNGDKTVYTIG